MQDCRIGRLSTEFTPQKITLIIELLPSGDTIFEEPVENAASKLDAVANYARSTFAVRPALINQMRDRQESHSSDRREPDHHTLPETPLIKVGNARALKVFEEQLSRARAEKDKKAIKIAEEQLASVRRHLSRKEVNDNAR